MPRTIDLVARIQQKKGLWMGLEISFIDGKGIKMSSLEVHGLQFVGMKQADFNYTNDDIAIVEFEFEYHEAKLFGTHSKNGPVELPVSI